MKWGAERGKKVCDRVTISFGVTFDWMKTLERKPVPFPSFVMFCSEFYNEVIICVKDFKLNEKTTNNSISAFAKLI